MKHIWSDNLTAPRPTRNPSPSPTTDGDTRASQRRLVTLPARLTWKDQRGTARFATVVTHDVCELGVYVECQSVASLPLYRIVQFQLERDARDSDDLPASLRQGRMLAAVYRVSPPTRGGTRQGFALRLMVDPKRQAAQARTALSA